MMKQHVHSASSSHAFTLIELLCVIAIIMILAGMLMPLSQSIIARAYDTTCSNNLRQIGIAANAAANDNNNTYPIVEINPDPSNPFVQNAFNIPALPLDKALAPYGVTPKILQCPCDLRGPNWYAANAPDSTSYMWSPYSEDTSSTVPTIYSRRRGQITIMLSRLVLCTDWSPVHTVTDGNYSAQMIFAVYGDGHVKNTRKPKPTPNPS